MSSRSEAGALARNRAQTHFKATELRESAVRAEIEKERAAVTAKTAKLRALRMAKEEEERAEADRLAAEAPKKKARVSAKKRAKPA